MEHRRQVVHEEVENMKLKRRFREEQVKSRVIMLGCQRITKSLCQRRKENDYRRAQV